MTAKHYFNTVENSYAPKSQHYLLVAMANVCRVESMVGPRAIEQRKHLSGVVHTVEMLRRVTDFLRLTGPKFLGKLCELSNLSRVGTGSWHEVVAFRFERRL